MVVGWILVQSHLEGTCWLDGSSLVTVGRHMVGILGIVLALCHNILTPEHYIINTGRVVAVSYERRLGWTVPYVLQKPIPILSLHSSRKPCMETEKDGKHVLLYNVH